MHGFGVAVLRFADEKHHQEGDDGRSGVDDELPRIGVVKSRAGQGPDDDDDNGPDEGPRGSEDMYRAWFAQWGAWKTVAGMAAAVARLIFRLTRSAKNKGLSFNRFDFHEPHFRSLLRPLF